MFEKVTSFPKEIWRPSQKIFLNIGAVYLRRILSIFKNNQITIFPCSTCIPETGVGLTKTDVSFYGVGKKSAFF